MPVLGVDILEVVLKHEAFQTKSLIILFDRACGSCACSEPTPLGSHKEYLGSNGLLHTQGIPWFQWLTASILVHNYSDHLEFRPE